MINSSGNPMLRNFRSQYSVCYRDLRRRQSSRNPKCPKIIEVTEGQAEYSVNVDTTGWFYSTVTWTCKMRIELKLGCKPC